MAIATGWSIEYILDHSTEWIKVMYKYITLQGLEQMKQGELIRRIENSIDIYNLGYDSGKKQKKDELTPAMMARMAGIKYEARNKDNG